MAALAIAVLMFALTGGSSSAMVASRTAAQVRMAIVYDGPHGIVNSTSSFSDCNIDFWSYGDVNQVDMRTGHLIDNIRLRYGAVYGPDHGGTGGTRSTLTLSPGEYITSAFGRVRSGSYLVSLGFRTSSGRVIGPLGTQQDATATYRNFEAVAPAGKKLVCIEGTVNVLAAIKAVESITFGWGAPN